MIDLFIALVSEYFIRIQGFGDIIKGTLVQNADRTWRIEVVIFTDKLLEFELLEGFLSVH